ncbi:MAG: M20 family metallopeptidase [Clostridia bacterium]
MELHPEVMALLNHCIKLRRDLHRIPEAGFEEYETQSYLVAELMKLGANRVEKIAQTGVKAVFYTEHPESTIAFRADIDGLKTAECNEVAYASRHEGRMHACGHDGHMTMVLLLARLISTHRDALKHNVVLLFQPGEEGLGGARHMIKGGALNNPDVDRIYGMHVWPSVERGKIGVRWGAMMAQTLEFDMIVHGKSAHGASPQLGVDAVVAAAQLITFLQAVITRNVDPHQDALLTIGRICGGTARNIIADEVTLNGTLRVFNAEVYKQMDMHIRSMLSGLEMATGTKIDLLPLMSYPCVDNPRPLVEEFYQHVNMDDVILVDQVMAAEDFACYQEQVPGLFLFLGIQGGKNNQPLHNCRFDFDEELLLTGVEVYQRLLGLLA